MTGSTNHQVGILADNTTYQDFCLQSNMAAAMLEYQWVSLGLFLRLFLDDGWHVYQKLWCEGFPKVRYPQTTSMNYFPNDPMVSALPCFAKHLLYVDTKGKNKIDQKHSPGFPHDAP